MFVILLGNKNELATRLDTQAHSEQDLIPNNSYSNQQTTFGNLKLDNQSLSIYDNEHGE